MPFCFWHVFQCLYVVKSVSELDEQYAHIVRHSDKKFTQTLYVSLYSVVLQFPELRHSFYKRQHLFTKLFFNCSRRYFCVFNCVMEDSCSYCSGVHVNRRKCFPYACHMKEIWFPRVAFLPLVCCFCKGISLFYKRNIVLCWIF